MIMATRRGALGGLAVAVGLANAATAAVMPTAPGVASGRTPAALRFDPAKLIGLSERLIRSHYDNNYLGSVKTLGMIETRLASAMADKDMPPVVYGGLKREHLNRTGSVILHEAYFNVLGGNGVVNGGIKAAIAARWGSAETWEAEFRRTAMALAGGSGWAVLAWSVVDGTLGTFWGSDHMHQPAGSVPIIALDMYEHAFALDYGAGAAKYVDAYFRNLDWEQIDRRWQAVSGFKLK